MDSPSSRAVADANDHGQNFSPVHQMRVKEAFDGLTTKEKLYAHHMSRAAWHGTRIILRQVSEEAIEIFDFIVELYNCCSGDWAALGTIANVDVANLEEFLSYAATFLSNVGNYYGRGDQKFVPKVTPEVVKKLASVSARATGLCRVILEPMLSQSPFSLGFPSEITQSAYYPGSAHVSKEEISLVSRKLERHHIYPENTRIQKDMSDGKPVYNVLQASIESDSVKEQLPIDDTGLLVCLVRGDHSQELSEVCEELSKALDYTVDTQQKTFISQYIQSFRTGDLGIYRESQRTWVADRAPNVENIFGFVEPYRDPLGMRAEFEALVGISNVKETMTLSKLVTNSDVFIRRLPWAAGCIENNGKGLFEKALFDAPDFASIHTLAYCSSIVFAGINLPNYNDIRQESGFKNVMIANQISAQAGTNETSPFLKTSENKEYQRHKHHATYLWVVFHELLGHGTGRLMVERDEEKSNFDINRPPMNPLTSKPIISWYRPGQTWTGQFADLATTVDECRAELVGAYLMDDSDILALFGYDENSEICSKDLTYYFYLELGISGLRGLRNYNVESGTWGQAHSRAHFAILKCLLRDGNGVMRVDYDSLFDKLTISVDRNRIVSHAKRAIGNMLLKLHIHRCTADIQSCRPYYEELSQVDGEYLEWRKTVLSTKQPRLNYVHANTFLQNDEVLLKEYGATNEGVIQSWAERCI